MAMDKLEQERIAPQRTTLVEEGTAFKGTFASDCPIIVRGKIEGDVTGPSLTVSSTGVVAGKVKVGVIESEGELSGEFEADVVRLSGRVRDKTVIRAKSLEVRLQPDKGMMQVVFGECAIDVGDMPSKEAIMGEAQSQHAPIAAANPGSEQGPALPTELRVEAAAGVAAPGVDALSAAEGSPEAGAEASAPDVTAAESEPESSVPMTAAHETEAAEQAIIVAPEHEKRERKNGRQRGPAGRPSSMPPPGE